MHKVIFSTTNQSAGTGIICNEDFSEPMFVAVNKVAGSSVYGFFMDGNSTSSGITYTSAAEAWEGLAEYLLASRVLPVGQAQIKKWFGKDEYNEKLKKFKYNLSDEKRKAAEENKLKKKTQSGGLWLKSGKNGYWN